MTLKTESSLATEAYLLLFEGSLSAIPFNGIAAIFIGIDFIHNKVPIKLVSIWFAIIFSVNVSRWIYTKLVIKKGYCAVNSKAALSIFLVFTSLIGLAWGGSYYMYFPYLNGTVEEVFIIVLGGLSAGAIASLAVYLPAFFCFVFPCFFPVIAYNLYLAAYDRVLLALMCSFFVVMICMLAKISSRLIRTTIKLGHEKDILINELTFTNLKLEQSIEEVRTMSIADSLTGLFNRRYFDMIFNNELSRAKRDKHDINLVFIDIDNFKYINDAFGHPKGDDFLIYVGDLLKNSLRRPHDTVFRLGDDEFAAVLTNMSSSEVLKFCEVLQNQFNINNQHKNVTLSIGIICISGMNVSDMQTIVTAADRILYQAKKAGKNQIMSKQIS
jgi:diguanylate cyclase (GGDEF)-like protein